MKNDYETGQKDTRPWGDWEVIDAAPGFAVKRIRVTPGGKLSLQRHNHRSEHWVVLSGSPTVLVGDSVRTLGPGQAVDIGVGVLHRLSNQGSEPAVIIEIQSGGLLCEEDIERLEDVYGRAAA